MSNEFSNKELNEIKHNIFLSFNKKLGSTPWTSTADEKGITYSWEVDGEKKEEYTLFSREWLQNKTAVETPKEDEKTKIISFIEFQDIFGMNENSCLVEYFDDRYQAELDGIKYISFKTQSQ